MRANALDNSVRLYRVEKGKRSQLGGKEAPIESGKWHSLRVIAANDRFEVALDGKMLFDATDRSLPQSGAMGVWSQADSVTHYGSLLVGPVRCDRAAAPSCRSSDRYARTARRISSVGGMRSGTMTVIMPAAGCGADTVVGILEGQAELGRHAQQSGRLQEGIGRGLVALA